MGNTANKDDQSERQEAAVAAEKKSDVLSGAEVAKVEEFCTEHCGHVVEALIALGVPKGMLDTVGLTNEAATFPEMLQAIEKAHSAKFNVETQFECFLATLSGESSSISDEETAILAQQDVDCADLSAFQSFLVACCGREKHDLKSKCLGYNRAQIWALCRWLHLDSRQVLTNLYSSLSNGDGVGAFTRSVAFYESPTLLIVRSSQGDVVGVYSDSEWQSQSRFFGTGRTRLFTILPICQSFATTNVSHNYLYLHIPTSKQTVKGVVPDGVGVGGQIEGFRLHLDADFKTGEAVTFDSTFENGQLVPLAAKVSADGNPDMVGFEIDAVEMFGLGGPAALVAQENKKQFEIKEAMKRRQVNKKIMLGGDDDDPDMWLLETAGAHQSYVKGEMIDAFLFNSNRSISFGLLIDFSFFSSEPRSIFFFPKSISALNSFLSLSLRTRTTFEQNTKAIRFISHIVL